MCIDGCRVCVLCSQPFTCIPIPGENPWVEASLEVQPLESDEDPTMGLSTKRTNQFIGESSGQQENAKKYAKSSSGSSLQSTICTPSPVGTRLHPKTSTDESSPYCSVLLYGDSSELSLKLNDMIEVVGVYSHCPQDNSTGGAAAGNNCCIVSPANDIMTVDAGGMFDSMLEFDGDAMKTANYPRIHCILVRKIAVSHTLTSVPTLMKCWEKSAIVTATSGTPMTVDDVVSSPGVDTCIELDDPTLHQTARTTILSELTSIFGNDTNAAAAARLVMFALISRLYRRSCSRTLEESQSQTGPSDLLLSVLSILELSVNVQKRTTNQWWDHSRFTSRDFRTAAIQELSRWRSF
jgi:hypothetical protein